MLKLNLGCGSNKRSDSVNVDNAPEVEADIQLDLNEHYWPWLSGSIDHIYAHHVLEHVGASPQGFIHVMQELWRILVPDGTLEIKAPHHHCDNFWNDPTHVRVITPQVLMLFDQKTCRESQARGWPNTPLGLFYNVNFELLSTNFVLMPYWGKLLNEGLIAKKEIDFAMQHYWNVVDEVTYVLRKRPLMPAA